MRIAFNYNLNFGTTRRTLYKNTETKQEYHKPYYTPYEDYVSFKKGTNPNFAIVKIKNSNATQFFRADMPYTKDSDYSGFARFLNKHFSEGKVNIYDFACSDGSEAYSIAISLIEEMGEEEAQRFFPIQAIDKDKYIIKEAANGIIECDTVDMRNIIANTHDKFDKYFEVLEQNGENYLLKVKEPLKNAVNFKIGKIENKLDDVKGSNNVVLCRNMWPYLSKESMFKAVLKLSNLDKNSLVVIGNYDRDHEMPSLLPRAFQLIGLKELDNNMLIKDESFEKRFANRNDYIMTLFNSCNYTSD